MRKFKYTGKKKRKLGRHGVVEPKQVIELTEEDAYFVLHSDSPELVLVREKTPEDFPSDPGMPPTGPHFNLAVLSWKKGSTIFREVRRLGRRKGYLALQQLEAVGFPIPRLHPQDDPKRFREVILETGRHAGWI